MSTVANKLQGISNFRTYSLAVGLRVLFILLTLYTILITAWVGDDIQISFRQIWNFINGDGITFNFGQRVQAFTHPLWFFVLSGVSFLSGELFLTTILTCVVFSMLAVLLLLKIEYSVFKEKLPVISPLYVLIFSWAFVDYTTSGLENSLSYFLTGLLLYLLFRQQLERDIRWVYLILALLVLNRFDYAVLFLPLALILIPKIRSLKGFLSAVWPGVLIIALWLLFATFYFGSPMPNTYYAKLNADYPMEEILFRGSRYFLALRQDHVSTLIMCSSLIVSLLSLNRILISIALGQSVYMLYIYHIGGDFMQGRFFSLPVYLSMGQIVLVFALKEKWKQHLNFKPLLMFLLVVITIGLVLGFPFLSGPDYSPRKKISRINDERGIYYQHFGLFARNRDSWPVVMDQGNKMPSEYKISAAYLGEMSLLDTSYFLIDPFALQDPFLSRIPAIRTKNWIIGHHLRKVPQEYGEYLVGNLKLLPDRKLQWLLDDVNIASRGDLFSSKRFGAILRLSTNYHSKRIDFSEYQDSEKFIPSTALSKTVYIKSWENAVEFDNLPRTLGGKFKRFNNNIKFESDIAKIADGIRINTGTFHLYDIYVNEKLVTDNNKFEDLTKYKVADYQIVKFDIPILVTSVELKAVDAKYFFTPPYNYISSLTLILNNK